MIRSINKGRLFLVVLAFTIVMPPVPSQSMEMGTFWNDDIEWSCDD